jgi:hypothetical protein
VEKKPNLPAANFSRTTILFVAPESIQQIARVVPASQHLFTQLRNSTGGSEFR